jgi:hypothetical protein
LTEQMFETGSALYGTFIFAAVFVAIIGAMQLKREQSKERLGQHDRAPALIKAFLPGFSFGSELLLVASLWTSNLNYAVPIMLFRFLHIFAGIAVVGAIFGSHEFALQLETLGFRKCSALTDWLDHGFARTNIPLIGLHCLLCLCDVTLVQFLPWKRSAFQTESKGFPSMSVMKMAFLVKTIQATVSVIVQVTYLGATSSDKLDKPTTSPQAKALFSLNIVFSIVGVVMSLLLLFIKEKLLSTVEEQDHDQDQDQRENSGVSGGGGGGSSNDNTSSSSPGRLDEKSSYAAELHEIYCSDGAADASVNTSNPMHNKTSSGSRSGGPRQSQAQMFALEEEFLEARKSLSLAAGEAAAGEEAAAAAAAAAAAGVGVGQDSLPGPTPTPDVVPAEFIL